VIKTMQIFILCGGLVGGPITASASSLLYTPVNPTFGGNPLNGTFLLSTAQAQGKGASSGANSPDLSGLTAALAGIGTGTTIIANPTGTSTVPTSP
jgi:curli production assembly/transport component CsgF